MSGKRPKYSPPIDSFNGPLKGQVFSGIYATQIQSPAWKRLSYKQRDTFLQMRMQEHTKVHPPAEFGTRTFYFPKSLWCATLELYRKNEQFYADVDALIEYGFIDCVSSGYTTKEKSVYRFSDRWKLYGTEYFEVPQSVKRMTVRR